MNFESGIRQIITYRILFSIILLLLIPTVDYADEPPEIPILICEEFPVNFEPTCLSNGLIGIRPRPNPLEISQTVVAGHTWDHPTLAIESYAPAPYPLAADIKIDGDSYWDQNVSLKIHKQSLHMSNGELLTEMSCKNVNGKVLEVTVLQFASRSVPSLLCQEIVLKPEQDMKIEYIAKIDYSRMRMENVHAYKDIPIPLTVYMDEAPGGNVDIVAGFKNKFKLGVAIVVDGGAELKVNADFDGHLAKKYEIDAKSGSTYTIKIIASMVAEIYHPAPDLQAVRMVKWGEVLGFDKLRNDNQKAWDELWKSRVKVYGDPLAQKGLDVAFFYLMSVVHTSKKTGIAPYGLSQYENYFGHVFWDMDNWMFLPVLLTSPDIARSLLECRVDGLEKAKRTAALYGYKGAHYPWEGSQTDGSETTPTSANTGWVQHHVTPDIVIPFWEYYMATGDEIFLKEKTWPVLKEIAYWIESRGVFTERGFEFQNIMGPDESLENTNNNAYMNIVTKMAMDAAIKCAEIMGYTPPHNWRRIHEQIIIPTDNEKNIILPYENPPDRFSNDYSLGMVHFLFLHQPPLDAQRIKNTYFFEEEARLKRNTDDPSNPGGKGAVGFVCPAYAAMAAFFGEKDKAATLFNACWKPYAIEPFSIGKEYQKHTWGSFYTSYGSLLMAGMLGFTGLRITENDWRQYPASLPRGWEKIEIDRIWIKGIPKKVIAVDGKLAQLLDSN